MPECEHEWVYVRTAKARDYHGLRPISRIYAILIYRCRHCGAHRQEVVGAEAEQPAD